MSPGTVKVLWLKLLLMFVIFVFVCFLFFLIMSTEGTYLQVR